MFSNTAFNSNLNFDSVMFTEFGVKTKDIPVLAASVAGVVVFVFNMYYFGIEV